MELRTLDDLNVIKNEGVKEGEKWEFKSTWPNNERIEETICAFANTSGGLILIGVNYNNTTDSIDGFPGIFKTRNLTERAINIGGNINPRVIPSSWLIEVGQDQVIQAIEVRKSRMIPHIASNGRYYFRADKTNVFMPESLIEKLYIARHAQREEATKILTDRKFFLMPREKPWLNICYCPLYLENDLVVHSRENLTFLNSLIAEIDRNLINIISFRSAYYGYNFLLPPTGNPNYLLEVYRHGLFVTGTLIEDLPAPLWEHLKLWFNKTLKIYSKLIERFKYPGFTRISLALNRMNNESVVFGDSRMDGMSVPPNLTEIILSQDFEDAEITGHGDDILKSFYIKLLAMHGLDDYIP